MHFRFPKLHCAISKMHVTLVNPVISSSLFHYTHTHTHRGATIEKCVEYLTGDVQYLWGGFTLTMRHQSPSGQTLNPKATKEQIFDFFLTTYQSFLRPTIFMRLLLHRLTSQDPGNPFDWSVQPDNISPAPHSSGVPPTQMNVLNIITRWMELFPNDFLEHPQLQDEVLSIIQRLKFARGGYIPYIHRLKSLLGEITHPRVDSSLAGGEIRERVPHHENLYSLVSGCLLKQSVHQIY